MATTMVSGSTGPKISSLRILCSSLMPLIRVRMYEMFELDIGIAFGAEKNNNEMLIYINSLNVGLRPTFPRPSGVRVPDVRITKP